MPRKAADSLVVPLPSISKRLKPPEALSAGARFEFLRIICCEKPEHFRDSDLPLLCQYCESAALAARATQELQRDDAPARWLTVWEKANRNMVALSARLRLCPQSRQANNPKRPEQASFYERMRLEERDGAQRD